MASASHCLFRDIAKAPGTWVSQRVPNALELLKHCDTRLASHVLMLDRYLSLRPILELLFANPEFKAWLRAQKAEIKKLGADCKVFVMADSHWNSIRVAVDTLVPFLKLLRLTDGKTGATLGKVYHHMATLAAQLEKPIPGVDEEDREHMWEIFMARWTYFHELIFTAAYFLDPEFIRGSGSADEEKEFKQVLREVSAAEHCEFSYSDMIVQWAAIQTAINVGSHGMDDKEASSEHWD